MYHFYGDQPRLQLVCGIHSLQGPGARGMSLLETSSFRRRFNFRVPRYHAPLERRVRVRRGPRHYELVVYLISAYMEFFCVMLVHDLEYSEILQEQLLYRRKNKSQNFSTLRATLSAAVRPLTSRPMAAPPFESFRWACGTSQTVATHPFLISFRMMIKSGKE